MKGDLVEARGTSTWMNGFLSSSNIYFYDIRVQIVQGMLRDGVQETSHKSGIELGLSSFDDGKFWLLDPLSLSVITRVISAKRPESCKAIEHTNVHFAKREELCRTKWLIRSRNTRLLTECSN
ncbi:hypothetical protein CAPTEDRAFT_211568 [Capitella teleta]|uniref:Uncharacterized protein n=1 Tax=Capitella teleta TaxID=283909 RepID=R7TV50_CAPTE|nr:hypothetical protein CAPTEDRAFT_211568 [Capitella teleta]|eukprot:ELT95321.1 hypothetical protein CAPTEDRAFT_211568 [Capitella teleta]